jgi:hypothetical protein
MQSRKERTMFVIELPADEYGNLAFTAGKVAVLEVEQVEERMSERYVHISYKPSAPQYFVDNWPSGFMARGWIEVDGPARFLTEQEYVTLLKQAIQSGKISEPYLVCAEARIRLGIR